MEPGLEFRELAPITDLEEGLKKEIATCLEELDALVPRKAAILVQEDHLKDRLEELQRQTGRKGFRHNLLCFMAIPVEGRKTLDKMLLMENGCPASVINQSYKKGEPSIRCLFKRLQEDQVK